MDFLILIKNGCDDLTATVAHLPLTSLGHMVLRLATIMLVWFGVQEALASAQVGQASTLRIHQLLRPNHIRLLLCEVLRQEDSWHWLFA